jgi:ribosomal protein S18 acetylase RimI-like enzyme
VIDPIEVAENANTYTPLGEGEERLDTGRYVLWLGRRNSPHSTVVQRLRLADGEVEDVRAEVHALLRERGRTSCTWEVGTHATPADLVDRLLALGLVDDRPDAHAVGMVLTDGTAIEAPAGVEVGLAETPEQRLAAERIACLAFGEPEPTEPPPAKGAEGGVYLAYVDGEPVARASAMFGPQAVSLFGGATLPEARGRGAYRALVAARWRDAVERGTPLLVTQAGRMSQPILERVGFRRVCEIRILLDEFGA